MTTKVTYFILDVRNCSPEFSLVRIIIENLASKFIKLLRINVSYFHLDVPNFSPEFSLPRIFLANLSSKFITLLIMKVFYFHLDIPNFSPKFFSCGDLFRESCEKNKLLTMKLYYFHFIVPILTPYDNDGFNEKNFMCHHILFKFRIKNSKIWNVDFSNILIKLWYCYVKKPTM